MIGNSNQEMSFFFTFTTILFCISTSSLTPLYTKTLVLNPSLPHKLDQGVGDQHFEFLILISLPPSLPLFSFEFCNWNLINLMVPPSLSFLLNFATGIWSIWWFCVSVWKFWLMNIFKISMLLYVFFLFWSFGHWNKLVVLVVSQWM